MTLLQIPQDQIRHINLAVNDYLTDHPEMELDGMELEIHVHYKLKNNAKKQDQPWNFIRYTEEVHHPRQSDDSDSVTNPG